MRRLLASTAIGAALLAPAIGHAQTQVVSERPDKVAVTVYPFGIAMVRETRTVDLPAGPARISFRGVADQIVPQTVALDGLPGPKAEQNFDYRLLSPGSLIAGAEGARVTHVRTDRLSGRVQQRPAVLVSSGQGAMLRTADGLEALSCSGGSERIVFNGIPEGFVTTPTLSTTAAGDGRRVQLTLSYLTTGLSWAPNYVMRLEGADRASLTAWITLTNASATTFGGAPVDVVAGQVSMVPGEDVPVLPERRVFTPDCWSINSGRTVQWGGENQALPVEVLGREDFFARGNPSTERMIRDLSEVGNVQGQSARVSDLGDYKLYSLPEPTTVAAAQTKQLLMFERADVTVRPVFRHRSATSEGVCARAPTYWPALLQQASGPQPAQRVLELVNDEASGLGLAMPAGSVSVFEPVGAVDVLKGQPRIRDTAADLPFDLEMGAAVAVHVESRTVACRFVGSGGARRAQADVEITWTNAQAQPALVQVREHTRRIGTRVVREQIAHHLEDGSLQWETSVPANGSASVKYTLEWASPT